MTDAGGRLAPAAAGLTDVADPAKSEAAKADLYDAAALLNGLESLFPSAPAVGRFLTRTADAGGLDLETLEADLETLDQMGREVDEVCGL